MSPPRRAALILAVGVAFVVVAALSYQAGRSRSTAAPGGAGPAVAAAKPLYWYDPMVPSQHFDHPGKSPFMDMQLVPKLADTGDGTAQAGADGLRVDQRAVQNLGVRTAVVSRGQLGDALVTTGVIEFNGRDVAIVQPRAAGFVQRTYARAPGDVVAAGAPIADLLVPEWGGAQAEFAAVRRTGDPALIAAARQRLRLLGMSDGLIAAVERTGRPQPTITVTTPVGGVIQKLDVRPGMTVTAGQSLAEVNGLRTVWITAAVPEAQAAQVRPGQGAAVSLDAFPGERFSGRVQTVLPQVAGESRTLQVRIELPNRGGRLRPGLFATVSFSGEGRPALLAPSEAIIRTGRRNLVMLAQAGGRYQAVEVRLGREAGDRTEILQGLSEGDRVVASGQFLLDSEASLSGLAVRPLGSQTPPAPGPTTTPAASRPTPPRLASTTGRVESVAPGAVTLSHQPVPFVGWPAMTMTFRVADPKLLQGVKAGDQVRFGFDQPAAGPTVRTLAKLGGTR